MIGYALHYKLGDYTLVVNANEALHVISQCPQCKRLL